MTPARSSNPVEALKRAIYLLDRGAAPSSKVRAFQRAIDTVAELPDGELEDLAEAGRLESLPNIGSSTGGVIADALAGRPSAYLDRLEAETVVPTGGPDGDALLTALRGDCHSHTTWSDGGASLRDMALTARSLGREYLVVTDHSPRLTIAHGLTRERLEAQLDEIAALNDELAPFRILTGIEVDILEDGSLDQDPDLLERLDVVVASAHSKLRMPREEMTRRLVTAVSNPHVDILGHCTNRKLTGRGRPQSTFDAEIVFAACDMFSVAVEINCRPDRLDPPDDLLALAWEYGCWISIDTDAHAPGQLEWLGHGCAKAATIGVTPDRLVNTMGADDLLAWTAEQGEGVGR
ncbi:MAG: PHP domain-containing protein [Acidimicrobiales bacterium]